MSDVLPDVFARGLRVVFCGSAAGGQSAAAGAYYAGPGNRFWSILYQIGLTPQRLAPTQFRDLLAYGIGLTDLAKIQAGADIEIADSVYDPPRLYRAIAHWRPRAVAFNGKRAGRLFFGKASYLRIAAGRLCRCGDFCFALNLGCGAALLG